MGNATRSHAPASKASTRSARDTGPDVSRRMGVLRGTAASSRSRRHADTAVSSGRSSASSSTSGRVVRARPSSWVALYARAIAKPAGARTDSRERVVHSSRLAIITRGGVSCIQAILYGREKNRGWARPGWRDRSGWAPFRGPSRQDLCEQARLRAMPLSRNDLSPATRVLRAARRAAAGPHHGRYWCGSTTVARRAVRPCCGRPTTRAGATRADRSAKSACANGIRRRRRPTASLAPAL